MEKISIEQVIDEIEKTSDPYGDPSEDLFEKDNQYTLLMKAKSLAWFYNNNKLQKSISKMMIIDLLRLCDKKIGRSDQDFSILLENHGLKDSINVILK